MKAKDYRSAMLVPYYHSGELPHDFVWVGISPNPEAHMVATIIGLIMVRNFKQS